MLSIELKKEAKAYSKAFFEVATEKHKLNELALELANLATQLTEIFAEGNYAKLFYLRRAEQKKIFDDILNKMSASVLIKNFFALMIVNNKLKTFIYLVLNYKDFLYFYQGYALVTVTSALELSAEQKNSLQTTFSEKLSGNFYIKYFIKPSILGGLTVNIEDLVLDDSLQTKLHKITTGVANI